MNVKIIREYFGFLTEDFVQTTCVGIHLEYLLTIPFKYKSFRSSFWVPSGIFHLLVLLAGEFFRISSGHLGMHVSFRIQKKAINLCLGSFAMLNLSPWWVTAELWYDEEKKIDFVSNSMAQKALDIKFINIVNTAWF